MYIKTQYKNVMFSSDLSGIKLPMGLSMKVKDLRSDNGFPDLPIYKPNKSYAGLFLELKKETPYKKDGGLKKQKGYRKVLGHKVEYDHLQEQRTMMERLTAEGYLCSFVWDFDQAVELINKYMADDAFEGDVFI